MAIDIHSAALKELQRFPSPVLFRAKEAFAFLELGENLSMPLSRPMPSIWPGCHEIRISDRQGGVSYHLRVCHEGEHLRTTLFPKEESVNATK